MSFKDKLPKTVHLIWLGTAPLPKLDLLVETWMKLNADWTVKIWRDADVATLKLKNQDLYNAATNAGMRSDIARYEILSQLGGVYADLDIIPGRALDPVLTTTGDKSGFIGVMANHKTWVTSAIMGALPGAIFLDRIIAGLKGTVAQYAARMAKDPMYAVNSAGAGAVSAIIGRTATDVEYFPADTFDVSDTKNVTANTITMHGSVQTWLAPTATIPAK